MTTKNSTTKKSAPKAKAAKAAAPKGTGIFRTALVTTATGAVAPVGPRVRGTKAQVAKVCRERNSELRPGAKRTWVPLPLLAEGGFTGELRAAKSAEAAKAGRKQSKHSTAKAPAAAKKAPAKKAGAKRSVKAGA